MITVNFIGGLGNQMFEYAFARAISEEYNDKEIVINPYFQIYYSLAIIGKPRFVHDSLLEHFKLNPDVSDIKKSIGLIKAIPDFIRYCLSNGPWNKKYLTPEKYYKRSEKGIYQMSGFTFFEHSPNTKKDKRITGLFQCEKYSAKIKNILMDEFTVKTPPSEANKRMIEEIASCNAVCVHIRRGDYTDPKWSFLNICNEDYYRRGINYIAEHTENPVFYVFSNTHEEIEWIKKNYHFDQPVKYVDLSNPDYEEMRLMYKCNHFVMSNSSFSWWASYLSANEKKIVVVPEKWQNTPYKGGKIDIYRDDMIKIPVNNNVEEKS